MNIIYVTSTLISCIKNIEFFFRQQTQNYYFYKESYLYHTLITKNSEKISLST